MSATLQLRIMQHIAEDY